MKGVIYMKIKHIKIKNFKGIKSIDFCPENKISVLQGGNGAGKTSFLQAVEFVLTGKHSSKEFIRYGCDTASVEVVIDDVCYTRNISTDNKIAQCMLDGEKILERDFNNMIALALDTNADDLKILSSSKIFEEMNAKEMSEFLSDHIPENISFKTLTDILGSDFDKNALKILRSSLGENFTPNKFLALYKEFYTSRREANREFKEVKALLKDKPDVPAYTKELVNAEKEALLREEGGYVNAVKLMKSYELAKSNYNKALIAKENLKEQVKKSKCEEPDEKIIVSAKTELEKLHSLSSKEHSVIATLEANNKTFEKTLKSLDKPICPLSSKLVCSTDKTALKSELEALIVNTRMQIKECMEQIENFKIEIDRLNEKISCYNKEKLKYKEFSMLKKQYDDFKLPELPATKPVIPDFDEKVIDSKKKALTQKYEELVRYEKYEADMKKYNLLQQKSSCYEALVSATNPSGVVIRMLLENYFSIFNDVCNKMAHELKTGFELRFISDNGIKLICTKNDESRMYEALSNGEKIIISFIVINMLNQLSGNQILFIDNLNELDPNNLVNFLTMLEDSNYENVFVCSVDYEDVKGAFDFIIHDNVY